MGTVKFPLTGEGLKNMAIFIAQLVREGIVFKTVESNDCYKVELTGGY